MSVRHRSGHEGRHSWSGAEVRSRVALRWLEQRGEAAIRRRNGLDRRQLRCLRGGTRRRDHWWTRRPEPNDRRGRSRSVGCRLPRHPLQHGRRRRRRARSEDPVRRRCRPRLVPRLVRHPEGHRDGRRNAGRGRLRLVPHEGERLCEGLAPLALGHDAAEDRGHLLGGDGAPLAARLERAFDGIPHALVELGTEDVDRHDARLG